MPDAKVPPASDYDATFYHAHPMTAILYAKNAGFDVLEDELTIASRDDMPGSSFVLHKVEDEKWCWVRV
jgi:hypothetical protein